MFVLKCEWVKYFFDLTQKYFVFNANLTLNKRKTYIYIRVYICGAFTWPKIHTCKKYIYANANIHLVWAGVYLHGGVYLHMCKLTFTYMQLRSHAQEYTRVQIIHICIICTPCVNQRMWTGLMLFDLRNNVSVARNNPAHSMTVKFVDIVRRLYDDQVISFLVRVEGSPIQ